MIDSKKTKNFGLISIVAITLLLNGCAAVHTTIAKKDLDVQTKMSDTVFLDPVGPDKKTIYVDIRNTSDKSNFDILSTVKRSLSTKGYTITTDPDRAHYWLRANVLSVDKASPTAAESALHAGYGGALAGGAAGALTGAAVSGGIGAAVGGGVGMLVGSAVELVANAAVKDVTYMAITDIELSEKTKRGVVVRKDSRRDHKNGIGGSSRETDSEIKNTKQYRIRVVSTANKVNLDYAEAAQPLTEGLARSISGLF
ncbi:complement resistance protein TraT [Crenothrix polyspora]|uniref:TraT complement resistance protein n=1 Tax=Crenothrix polyspora TaxID=360316 RepID=A0A1R4HE77_9GAMM|nr:complement resistance protein TraT [Crenothrix polyspora]SJM94523.1 TraT complement resistance protein [Crenothrix polyspora]